VRNECVKKKRKVKQEEEEEAQERKEPKTRKKKKKKEKKRASSLRPFPSLPSFPKRRALTRVYPSFFFVSRNLP
jgi:hypothetical protein